MNEMSYHLKSRGAQYYHSAEGQGKHLTLSKASLGEFVYGVLKRGGEIMQLWPFQPEYRCTVYLVVAMTPAAKEDFEKETGFRLTDPPKVKLC